MRIIFSNIFAFTILLLLTSVESVVLGDELSENHKDVRLTVSLEKKNDTYILNFGLKNVSRQTIRFFDSNLPWGTPGSIKLILLDLIHDKVLEESLELYDPDSRISTLSVNQEVFGKVMLSERFPKLEKLSRDSDIAVFWTYQFKSTDGHPFKRMGGWLLIPGAKGDM